jgi:hypothetical protein
MILRKPNYTKFQQLTDKRAQNHSKASRHSTVNRQHSSDDITSAFMPTRCLSRSLMPVIMKSSTSSSWITLFSPFSVQMLFLWLHLKNFEYVFLYSASCPSRYITDWPYHNLLAWFSCGVLFTLIYSLTCFCPTLGHLQRLMSKTILTLLWYTDIRVKVPCSNVYKIH